MSEESPGGAASEDTDEPPVPGTDPPAGDADPEPASVAEEDEAEEVEKEVEEAQGTPPTSTGEPTAIEAGMSLIVVGYDAWTEQVLAELQQRDAAITVVTTDDDAADRLDDEQVDVVLTDDVDEACFRAAGIDNADAVLVATLDDQLNVLAVLTVRNVDQEIPVATFAGETRDVEKLRAAGADRVVSLGHAIAELLVEVALTEREVADVVDELSTALS